MRLVFQQKIDSFLFAPTSPSPLGICRLLFCGWLFAWYFTFDFAAIAYHPEEFWRPILLLRLLGTDEMPSAATLQIIQEVWKASLLLACVGLASRASLMVALILGTYLLGLTHSFYKINHSDAGLVLALGVLAISRCGDAFSLDSLLSRPIRKRRGQQAERIPSGEYRWPIMTVQMILVGAMFCAGVSKLIAWDGWIFSDNLHTILVHCQLSRNLPLALDLSLPGIRMLCIVAALGTVLVEIMAPLALFVARLRLLLILSLFGMQAGIRVLMGDDFTQFMALYLFWLPWNGMLAWMSQRFGESERELPAGMSADATAPAASLSDFILDNEGDGTSRPP